MMLYRPFLHYILPNSTAGQKIADRYYNCAAAGITVSRNIIHIGAEIQKQSTLIGPYWFILYTEFFAIISLIFFVLENPDKPGSAEILTEAKAGRDVIASLAQRSLAADRITAALNVSPYGPDFPEVLDILVLTGCQSLFEQLPENVKKNTAQPTPTKKRSAPAQGSQGSRPGSATFAGRPDLQEGVPPRRSEDKGRPPIGLLRREARAPPQRTSSFDTAGFPQGGSLAGQNFSNLSDILPMNMPLTGARSDPNSPQGPAHRQVQGFQQGQAAGGPASSLFKMDAMMFPSEDPFAYPNQPMMDPASHHAGGQPPQSGAGQPHDPMQFYIPSMYEGIEGQLLDPIPSYLMHQGQGQGQGQRQPQPQHGALSAAAHMYNNPGMLSMQPGHGSHAHQQGQQRHHHHQPMAQHPHPHPHHQHPHQQPHQHQHQHQHPHQHQQGGMMNEMLADPNFQGDWDDMLHDNSEYR